MTTINEKEKNMLRAVLAHPMADVILNGFEKEAQTLRNKLNKKKIDKKAKIEPFVLQHFVFETVNGNGSIVVTSEKDPDPKRNYICSVDYRDKESFLSFLRYLLDLNDFYGNPLYSYQKTYSDMFTVCEDDWIERTYTIGSEGMDFDGTPDFEQYGKWTRIRPSKLPEIIGMLIPRLFKDYPSDVEAFGEKIVSLHQKWCEMDKTYENKVFL